MRYPKRTPTCHRGRVSRCGHGTTVTMLAQMMMILSQARQTNSESESLARLPGPAAAALVASPITWHWQLSRPGAPGSVAGRRRRCWLRQPFSPARRAEPRSGARGSTGLGSSYVTLLLPKMAWSMAPNAAVADIRCYGRFAVVSTPVQLVALGGR